MSAPLRIDISGTAAIAQLVHLPRSSTVRAAVRAAVLGAMLGSVLVADARAQRPVAVDSTLTVELLTVGQGEAVWERFGHNALIITDRSTRTAAAYNWGVFDFNQPGFLARFFTGDTKYWVAVYDARAMIEYYKSTNRTVEIQRLALTQDQARALRNLAARNAEEENKYYRYDYFRDNCSTRIRDLIDQAVGGALRRATEGVPGDGTFRTHTQRLVADDHLIYTGLTMALGRRADSTLSRWDEMFIPMRVRDRVRELRVPGPDGTLVPLVAQEQLLFATSRASERTQPPAWAGVYFALGALVAALVLSLARVAPRVGRARVALAAVGACWGIGAGIVGIILLLAATVTRHVYWQQDVSLALLPPTGLLFAPFWWRWLMRGAAGRATTLAFGLFLGPPVLGTIVALLDGGWHGALPIIALTLPLHASLVAAVTLVSSRDPSRTLRFTAG